MITNLPRVAALVHGAGPKYAALASEYFGDQPNAIVWLPTPVIPPGTEHVYRWAADAEVSDPHVNLDDPLNLAYLLFASNSDPLTEDLDDTAAMRLIDHALAQVRCDMQECINVAFGEIYHHPEAIAPRWKHCITRGARLAGTEA